MPTADKFSTNGVYNGFPSCFQKVDIRGFDFWITASGYNKDDSAQAPTQAQIDQSLQAAGKLFWNLHKVNVDTFYDEWSLSEQFVTGIDNGVVADAIEPRERVCGGSLSINLDIDRNIPIIRGEISTTDIHRFYNGATTDETNFIGYGFGLIDLEAGISQASSTIATSADDLDVTHSLVWLGGYGMDYDTGHTDVYEYVERGGIHFLFAGHAQGSWEDVDAETLMAKTSNFQNDAIYTKAQITGL